LSRKRCGPEDLDDGEPFRVNVERWLRGAENGGQ
jgi:hypothetical protein